MTGAVWSFEMNPSQAMCIRTEVDLRRCSTAIKPNFLGNCSSFERAVDRTLPDVVATASTRRRNRYRCYRE